MNHKLEPQILKVEGTWVSWVFRLGWRQGCELAQVTQHVSSYTQWDQDHHREDGFLKEKVAVCQLQRNYKNKFLAENLKG